MRIKDFKTKFEVEDVVWFMLDNKPRKGIIERIKYMKEERINITSSYTDVVSRIKSFLKGKESKESVSYTVTLLTHDNKYHSCPYYLDDTTAYRTKEELLNSL